MRGIAIAGLVLSLLVGATPAGGGTPQPDAGPPGTLAGGTPADIDSSAEEVAVVLRQMAASLSLADEAVLEALEAEIAAQTGAATERWAATGPVLDGRLRRTALDDLAASWQRLAVALDELGERVRVRLRRREANLETLTRLHGSWTRALELARNAGEPQSVLERAQATVAAIDGMRPAIEQRRSRLLVRLDAVTRARQTCDDALARIADARRDAIVRVFARDAPPVWRTASAGPEPAADRSRTADGLSADAEMFASYVRAYPGGFVFAGLLVLGLGLVLRRGRSRAKHLVAEQASPTVLATVFGTPWAAAVLLGLGFSVPLRPYPPIALQYLMMNMGAVAAVFLLRPLVDVRFVPVLWAAAVLLALDLVRALAVIPPWPEQLMLSVQLSVVAALLLRAAGIVRDPASGVPPGLRSGAGAFLVAVALGCAGSAMAAALGWVQLADFVGSGLFDLTVAAFAVLAFRLAAWGLLALAFVDGPLARVRAVAHHRALVERRLQLALDLTAAALWILIVLRRLEFVDAAKLTVQAIVHARLQVGELDLELGRVLGFVAVVATAVLTTRVAVFVLEEDVFSRMALPRGVPYALSTLTRYGLLLAGFLLALATLGFDLTRVTVLLSAFGLGIGFGLQQIVNNFVSGLILIFERPVQVGDSVQLGDLSGEVRRIGIRSSTLRTSQGAEVIIPNSKLLDDKVTNWTLSDRRRRIDLDVSVAYDADAADIIALMVEVAGRDPRVHPQPPPEALLVRFGDKPVGDHFADFQLRVWTDDPQWMRLRSDLGVALQRELRARLVAAANGGQGAAAATEGEPGAERAPGVPRRRDS